MDRIFNGGIGVFGSDVLLQWITYIYISRIAKANTQVIN